MAMCGWFSAAQQPRLTRESRQPIRIAREGLRQHLDRDVPSELRVARAKHLAHAARPKWADNLERPEFRADGEATCDPGF